VDTFEEGVTTYFYESDIVIWSGEAIYFGMVKTTIGVLGYREVS
jgi:hypothetical protein